MMTSALNLSPETGKSVTPLSNQRLTEAIALGVRCEPIDLFDKIEVKGYHFNSADLPDYD